MIVLLLIFRNEASLSTKSYILSIYHIYVYTAIIGDLCGTVLSGILLPILSRKLFALCRNSNQSRVHNILHIRTFLLSSSLAFFRFYLRLWCIYLLSLSFLLVCVYFYELGSGRRINNLWLFAMSAIVPPFATSTSSISLEFFFSGPLVRQQQQQQQHLSV